MSDDSGGERRTAALPSVSATGGQPFHVAFTQTMTSSQTSNGVGFYDVPAGKMLVIEHVSALVSLPADQNTWTAPYINTNIGGVGRVKYLMEPTPLDNPGRFVISQGLTLYADPGTTVYMTVWRSGNTGTGNYYWGISGYLVDA